MLLTLRQNKRVVMQGNILENIDCLKGMKQIPDDSIDIIIIDPPYNIGKDFGNDSDKKSFPDYIEWVKIWLAECKRILKPSGTMFIYGFDEILAHISVLLPVKQHRWLIWYYTNKNVASLNFWQRSHESILCYWKNSPIFNRDAIREPYTESFIKGSAGKIRPASGTGRGGKGKSIYNANPLGALPRDVIKNSTLAGGKSLQERLLYCKTCGKLIDPKKRKQHLDHDLIIHPTQKPLELTDKLIKSCKPDKDFTVLIPFCGSGSECIATLMNHGTYIAFELNPDYVLLAQEGIKEYSKKINKSLFD